MSQNGYVCQAPPRPNPRVKARRTLSQNGYGRNSVVYRRGREAIEADFGAAGTVRTSPAIEIGLKDQVGHQTTENQRLAANK